MALVDRKFVAPIVHRRARLLALFFGVTIAVAPTARVECRDEASVLRLGPSVATGGGSVLTGGGHRQCELELGAA